MNRTSITTTVPGRALADELARLHKPCMLKIYPAVGQTSEDGHNMLYEAMPYWEDDVFKFLDEKGYFECAA